MKCDCGEEATIFVRTERSLVELLSGKRGGKFTKLCWLCHIHFMAPIRDWNKVKNISKEEYESAVAIQDVMNS